MTAARQEKVQVWTFWLSSLVLLPATVANLLVTAVAFEQKARLLRRVAVLEQRLASAGQSQPR